MIRMIQRRLIIPRGDTGSFSIPYLKAINPGDVAVFTIFDIRTKTKMYQKLIAAEGDILNIAFTHGDTVNLKPGKYLWDIKFYTNPQIIDDELVNGDEVDSYYAGFSLPECEIRETGDTLLTSDDAPTSTISPESLNIINAAINEILNTKRITVEAAETASSKADAAAESAEDASDSAAAASQSAALAEARVNEIESLSVEVNTGLEGTDASVTYTPSTGVLSFIIPRGNTGNGIASCVLNDDFTLTINYTNGDSTTTIPIRGDTPHLTIGEVTEGPHAIATITGTDANPILNLTLPNANVPTKLSQLTDDIGVAGKANSADLAAVATSGSYTDLGDKPYIPVKTSDLTNDSNYAIDSNYVHTDNNYTTAEKNKLSGIAVGAEVNVNADWNAVSGDAQILNKPTKLSDFLNDEGYLTEHQDISSKADKSEIPTKISQLQNDSGYLTSFTETDPTVPTWAKAAQKPSYTAAEVGAPTVAEMNTAIGNAIGNINSFDMAVVQALPEQNISTHTIYLVPKIGETNDVYDEYVYINSAWEMVGNTQIDLSNYATKSEIPNVPVQEVQINGSSILSSGVANIQKASSNNLGVVGIEPQSGVAIASNGKLEINPASTADIKKGEHTNKPIVPFKQDVATFYGLATAAGDTTQSTSNNTVGTYTKEAKTAIQTMLNVPAKEDVPIKVSDLTNDVGYLTQHQDISGKANSADLAAVATSGSYNDLLNKPFIPSRVSDLTDDSGHYTKPAGGIPAADLAETYLTQHQDISDKLDVSLKGAANGLAELGADGKVPSSQLPSYVDDVIEYDNINAFPATGETGKIYVAKNTNLTYRWGGSDYVVISPSLALGDTSSTAFRGDYGSAAYAHAVTNKGAAFNNGLYKITTNAEGHVTAATAVEKSDITELGIPAQDTTYESKIAAENGTNISLVTTGEKYSWNNKYDKPANGIPAADIAGGVIPDSIMDLTNDSNFVSASFDDNNLILQTGGQGTNIALPVQDVQVNGTSILNNGVANVPLATSSNPGVIKVADGLGMSSTGGLRIQAGIEAQIKSGTDYYRPIVPVHQHESTFYGLAKAAGDTTQSASSNAVGVYTETAKSKISDMLNAPVSVSGSTPSIPAMAGVQYVCGEVSTLAIEIPTSGCFDVVFESGSTATVMSFTLPTAQHTLVWENGFDPTSLDANTTYEINIKIVGTKCLGVVGSWA